jgi:hypothetical protein
MTFDELREDAEDNVDAEQVVAVLKYLVNDYAYENNITADELPTKLSVENLFFHGLQVFKDEEHDFSELLRGVSERTLEYCRTVLFRNPFAFCAAAIPVWRMLTSAARPVKHVPKYLMTSVVTGFSDTSIAGCRYVAELKGDKYTHGSLLTLLEQTFSRLLTRVGEEGFDAIHSGATFEPRFEEFFGAEQK